MPAPVATFFYLVWPPARLPALLRSCCSFGTLACCRRSFTPVCLRKRDLVLVLFRVVAFGVGVLFDPAATVCAALCCYLTGVEPGRWPRCTCHFLRPLAAFAPVSAIGFVFVSVLGRVFSGGCCGVVPLCLLPQLRQVLFRWVPGCSCHWGLSPTPTTSSNTVSWSCLFLLLVWRLLLCWGVFSWWLL